MSPTESLLPSTSGSPASAATDLLHRDALGARVRQLLDDGQLTAAQALLSRHPELQDQKSLVLDLAYEEYCRRKEEGSPLYPAEFCARFPAFQSSLRRLIGAHQFLEENPQLLADWRRAPWPAAGQRFAGYALLRELGRGAFARVFLAAEDALGSRHVVVKISRYETTEAHTLGRLNHPNIVPVHSVQEDTQTGFTSICMPYLGNATLCDVLDLAFAHGRRPKSGRVVLEAVRRATGSLGEPSEEHTSRSVGTYIDAVLRIGCQLADALAFAHSLGIFHRDLKPSNILMVADGRPMLLDFNLAFDQHRTENRVGGTLPYMPAEQLRATDPDLSGDVASVDARSDLYALGVILYELLTGSHPFGPLPEMGQSREMRQQLLERQRLGARSLREVNPDVDQPLARLVEQCLAFDPAQRPPGAANLAVELRRGLSWRRRLGRWTARHRLSAGLTSTACFGLIVSGVLLLATRDPYNVREAQSGLTCYRKGQYTEAIAHFNRSLEAAPNTISVLFARGRAHQRREEFNLAFADFQAVDDQAGDGAAKACMGYCLCRLGHYREAVFFFQRAIDAGVARAEVFNDLGYCHLLLGELDAANTALGRAIALDPTLQAPYYNRALTQAQWLLLRPGQGPDKAVADIRRALAIGPPAADLLRHAAGLHAQAGQFDPALAALEGAMAQGQNPKAVALDPLFRPLRENARFQELTRSPGSGRTPSKATRILDPIQDPAG